MDGDVLFDVDELASDIDMLECQLELMSYIDSIACVSTDMFFASLLSDVRVGRHLEWYDRFFSNNEFRGLVDHYCYERRMGVLADDSTYVGWQLDLVRRKYAAAVGDGVSA